MTRLYAHNPTQEDGTPQGFWYIDHDGTSWGAVATVWGSAASGPDDVGATARLLAAAPTLRDFLRLLIERNLISDTSVRYDAINLLSSIKGDPTP